jgi:hypothetical protein
MSPLLHEGGEAAARQSEQSVRRVKLLGLAVIHDEYTVAVEDRVDAMGDRQTRRVSELLADRPLDLLVGIHVDLAVVSQSGRGVRNGGGVTLTDAVASSKRMTLDLRKRALAMHKSCLCSCETSFFMRGNGERRRCLRDALHGSQARLSYEWYNLPAGERNMQRVTWIHKS